MDVSEIARERWISPLLARKKVEEASELCVLNKRVQHLSLLFYLNGGKKDKLFVQTHPL